MPAAQIKRIVFAYNTTAEAAGSGELLSLEIKTRAITVKGDVSPFIIKSNKAKNLQREEG